MNVNGVGLEMRIGAVPEGNDGCLTGLELYRYGYNYSSGSLSSTKVRVVDANEHWCRYVEIDSDDQKLHTVSIKNLLGSGLIFSGTGVTVYFKEENPLKALCLLESHLVKKADDLLAQLDRTADRLDNVRSMIKEAR